MSNRDNPYPWSYWYRGRYKKTKCLIYEKGYDNRDSILWYLFREIKEDKEIFCLYSYNGLLEPPFFLRETWENEREMHGHLSFDFTVSKKEVEWLRNTERKGAKYKPDKFWEGY
jgi:hypothetical protein